MTSGNNIVLSGLMPYDEANIQERLLDYDLAFGWVLFGDSDVGQGTDSSGYATGSFEVQPGDSVPQFGFTSNADAGGDGSTIDLSEASINGGELIFSLRILSGAIPSFEVRLDAADGTFAVVELNSNMYGAMASYDWQEFHFNLGDFSGADLTSIERITIAPDSAQSEVLQYEIAQLRMTMSVASL